MNEYPNWINGTTPHTDANAKIIRTRAATDVDAIEVHNGQYRSATLSGTFELVNPPAAQLPGRVLIRCAWHGVTPSTTYPQLDISNANVTTLRNYTGQVADDIGS